MRFIRAAALAVLLAASTAGEAVAQQPPIRTDQGGILINFQDADLAYVFSALAQTAGINIVYSNLPTTAVTLRTFQPIRPAEVLPLIRSIAAANGVSVTEGIGFLSLQGVGGDANIPPDLRQLYIYALKHARAPQLATTLQTLFGFGNTTPGRTTITTQTLGQQLQGLQQQQQQQVVRPQGFVVSGVGGALQNVVLIVPDEVTNRLLVRATPADWLIIQAAVQALDLRPQQVVIEVVIAEVRRTDDLNVGITVRGTDPPGTAANSTTGDLNRDANAPDNFSLRILRTGRISVDATLSALAATGNVRILSRPVIQAQNNQEATITVGEQRPFVQISRSLPTDQGARDEVVQYRNVATTLTITPTINPDGYVNLALLQEVNTASNEVQFGAPIISTRSASTQLLARDGQTVVIGGLVDRQEQKARSGIPFLKDIPVLGYLFGSTRNNTINSELFLFLTPHIVSDDEDADRMKREIERSSLQLGPMKPIVPLIRPIRPDTIRREP